ncbi:MAG TPA: radical SAM protein [Thermoanaerobaculia bacterium]|nr:radical SAM protein [Thermoanaerobaculia bacterium]
MVGHGRFKTAIVSTDALAEAEGQRVVARCRAANIEVIALDDADNEVALAPGTLQIGSVPPRGWITMAEHGTLSTRRNEYYLHPIEGCRSSCVYCYLRGNGIGLRPVRLYVAAERLLAEIERLIRKSLAPEYLFSTGERADSLSEIDLYPVACYLVEFVAMHRSARLELRSKSAAVGPLLQLAHAGRTTVAFSIAPSEYVDRFEPGTATLSSRLAAARRCQDAGYRIAFNLEPLFVIDGWRGAYRNMLSEMTTVLRVEELEHVSVGCLRFSKDLESTTTFNAAFGRLLAAREYIEYRPGVFNGTLAFGDRVAAYRYIESAIRAANVSAPIYWSFEEQRLLDVLQAGGR